jgi:1-acyl-sn-glycerol-3-phosphate acyltransferase
MSIASHLREPARLPPAHLSSARAGLRDAAAFYLVLAAFCLGSLGWSLLAGLLVHLLPRRQGAAVGQCAIMLGFRAGLALMRLAGLARFDLAALDAVRAQGPAVIACNHLSLIDALLVISRLPRAVCISKAGLWDNPCLGGSVRLAGYIRNDAPLALVRAAGRALRDGRQLVIFPEGTRSDGHGMGPFKPGFALMAKTARVPVQTVFLDSNTPYLRRGWKLHHMPEFPLCYRARCGRRIAVTGDVTAAAAQIERYFAEELTHAGELTHVEAPGGA